jgi:hypothetical protein
MKELQKHLNKDIDQFLSQHERAKRLLSYLIERIIIYSKGESEFEEDLGIS